MKLSQGIFRYGFREGLALFLDRSDLRDYLSGRDSLDKIDWTGTYIPFLAATLSPCSFATDLNVECEYSDSSGRGQIAVIADGERLSESGEGISVKAAIEELFYYCGISVKRNKMASCNQNLSISVTDGEHINDMNGSYQVLYEDGRWHYMATLHSVGLKSKPALGADAG